MSEIQVPRPRRVNLHLRLDENLRAQIGQAAERSLRSIHSEIMFRLKTSFEQDEAAA